MKTSDNHSGDAQTATGRTTKKDDKDQLEARARELGAELISLGKNSLRLAIELGTVLEELKTIIRKKKRKWEAYVEAELGIAPRRASNFMRLAKERKKLESLMKQESESVSDLGIRAALDLLAKKGKKPGKDSAPSAEVPLADGSSYKLANAHWSEGLVSRDDLDRAIETLQPKEDNEVSSLEASRNQRAVIVLAAAANRIVGKAAPEKAIPLLEEAFRIVKRTIEEGQAPSKTTDSK